MHENIIKNKRMKLNKTHFKFCTLKTRKVIYIKQLMYYDNMHTDADVNLCVQMCALMCVCVYMHMQMYVIVDDYTYMCI